MVSSISNKLIQQKLNTLSFQIILRRVSNSRTPAAAVFIERYHEEPVIVMCEKDVDIIGPPDPKSNIRPVIRKRLLSETVLQKKLRELQNATHAWNQAFWTKHNTNFKKERQDYINSHQFKGEESRQLTADEMSEFYKEFLDKNWQQHVKYNLEWYQRNFHALFLALRVTVERNLRKIL